ncbi:unnamed protein product [Meloidogyne enterolobii]|uniref:Uncharacterized protein n=1 Tax=Meloidogyne enterolobii TaxID=390850 RepID=A0ACB0YU53_MELEN
MQMRLLGGTQISEGVDSDIEVHKGEVPERELPPQDSPEKSNKDDEHPRDKRATCTYKNVFSSRIKWSECAPIINRVSHQGRCGSCWAFSTSGVKELETNGPVVAIFEAYSDLYAHKGGVYRVNFILKFEVFRMSLA